MIKLELPKKPEELTTEEEAALVAEYKATKKEVWRQKYIVNALLKMSHNKCAFSEQALNTESAYMEVEHFRCKDIYEDEVVKWGNLLPICKKCNTTKHDLDVCKTPIVNPLTDYPKDYLYVKSFRFYKKNEKGQNTIEAVALNDREHFVNPRFEIGIKIAETLEANREILITTTNPIRRRHAINRIKNVLKDCGPEHVYSAVLSTYVLYENPTYTDIKTYLTENALWDKELEEIEKTLLVCALPAPQ